MGGFLNTALRVGEGVATAGGSEAYRALSQPGQLLGPNDVPPVAPADPNNAQFGAGNGTDLSNQLAALQAQGGYDQQAAQNEREGALYNQANGNFDIANAAQMRGASQIQGSADDQARQIAALGGINGSAQNLNATGAQLTDIGTRAMGPSVAEAQLRQGQDSAMAQQLSMARSGRSLGAGQANMQQAAFNNAALNQQTNQSAAAARLQEQQNYQNMQLSALGAAGQNYNAAGGMSGQAGNLATTVRTGNEGLQAQNAQLDQNQQQINNQTTGTYNQLGSQQQALGMQANQLGLQAQNQGNQNALDIQKAQLAANTTLNGQNTAISTANNAQANASQTSQKAATLGLVSSGLGAAATMSDERQKTSIQPLEGATTIPFSSAPQSNIHGTLIAAPVDPVTASFAPGTDESRFQVAKYDPAAGIQDTTTVVDPKAAGRSYLDQFQALGAHYAPSMRAPADVLNHVPGAGAGPSASQAALLQHFAARNPANAAQQLPSKEDMNSHRMGQAPTSAGAAFLPGAAPVSSDEHSKTRIRDLETQLAALSADSPPTDGETTRLPQGQEQGFNRWLKSNNVRDLDNPDAHYDYRGAYLAGVGRGPGETGHFTDQFKQHGHPTFSVESQYSKNANDGGTWDGEQFSPAVSPRAPDTASLDDAYARAGQPPAVDLTAARGYAYDYKDPSAPGAAPGRHVGPMAQALEHTAAAGTVHDTPHGKTVDTSRLSMVNTAAISEQQRKTQALEAQLAALQGGGYSPAPYDSGLYRGMGGR